MLQKEMFLIAKYIADVWDASEYLPHNHGAYSEAVEVSNDELKSYGLVVEQKNIICLTDLGKEVALLIDNDLKENEKEAIQEFKEFMNKMTIDEALVYSYLSFPEYTTDSAIRDKVNRSRVFASISMYKKGLINLEKAMFLSGLSGKNFLQKAREA